MRWKSNPTYDAFFSIEFEGETSFSLCMNSKLYSNSEKIPNWVLLLSLGFKKSFVSLTNTYMGVCSFFIVKLISRNFTTGHCIAFTLIITNPLFLSAEHCIGYVFDAPASPLVKSNSKKRKSYFFKINKKASLLLDLWLRRKTNAGALAPLFPMLLCI